MAAALLLAGVTQEGRRWQIQCGWQRGGASNRRPLRFGRGVAKSADQCGPQQTLELCSSAADD
jgi:hypothetical protein